MVLGGKQWQAHCRGIMLELALAASALAVKVVLEALKQLSLCHEISGLHVAGCLWCCQPPLWLRQHRAFWLCRVVCGKRAGCALFCHVEDQCVGMCCFGCRTRRGACDNRLKFAARLAGGVGDNHGCHLKPCKAVMSPYCYVSVGGSAARVR